MEVNLHKLADAKYISELRLTQDALPYTALRESQVSYSRSYSHKYDGDLPDAFQVSNGKHLVHLLHETYSFRIAQCFFLFSYLP